MSACHLIVCEKTGHWAAVLRQAVEPDGLRVVETHGLNACREQLGLAPASLVAIHVTAAKMEACADFLVAAGQCYPRARFAVLHGPDEIGLVPALLEAGAILAAGSLLEAPRLARLAVRHFSFAPKQQASLEKLVTERMPWKAFATMKNEPSR